MRSTTKARVSIAICLCISFVFGIVSFWLMYKAGCAQNAAGDTENSLDISFFAVQAMIISYGLLLTVFMVWPNVRPNISVLKAIGFFLIWVPVTSIIAISIENQGSGECAENRWRQRSHSEGVQFNHGNFYGRLVA